MKQPRPGPQMSRKPLYHYHTLLFHHHGSPNSTSYISPSTPETLVYMVLFSGIKQKLTWVKHEPMGKETRSVIDQLIDIEPGNTCPDVTIAVLAPLDERWDNVLADTVSVTGCRCTFCNLRPTQEATEWLQRKRSAQVISAAIDDSLLPNGSDLGVLYGKPLRGPQRGNSPPPSSSSSSSTLIRVHRRPSHHVVSLPGFKQSVATNVDLPSGVQKVTPHHTPGVHGSSAPPPYSAHDPSPTDSAGPS